MKKRLVAFLVVAMLLVAAMGGCSQAQQSSSASSTSTASSASAASSTSSASSTDARAKELVASMTTEQKLAQMMIISLRSSDNAYMVTEVDDQIASYLKKYDFGGLALFQGNMVDSKQAITFIRANQEAAKSSEKGIPMFMSTDEEGGSVNRIAFGVTGPGNMALAATGDMSLTSESATLLGEEAFALGINMDYAPVADVNTNPNNPIIGVRSFSDDPNIAAQYVSAFAKAMQDTGMLTALKHFPGHGDVDEDSHTGLPASDSTISDLEACELIPFKQGIKDGTDMIMTAHIEFPAIEKDTYKSIKDGKEIYLPATLSDDILTGLLRQKMGYDGVIITDSMTMKAITENFTPSDAATMAINAGADIVLDPLGLYTSEGAATYTAIDDLMSDLVKRVESGAISEERINESVERILKLKIESGIMDGTLATSAEEQIAYAEKTIGSAEHLNRDWGLAQKAVTLLKNDGMLPLNGSDGSHTLILYPSKTRQATVDYAITRLQGKGLLADGAATSMCYAELKADDAELQAALNAADQVLLMSQSAAKNEEISKVVDQAQAAGKKVALLSLNVPYDAACYTQANAVICGFQPYGSAHDAEGNGPVNMNNAVVLFSAFGESTPQGTLPVSVPKLEEGSQNTFSTTDLLYDRGFGLKNWGK